MSIVISHWSALQIHALIRTGVLPPLRKSPITSLDEATSNACDLRETGVIKLLGDERPIDVLVGKRSARRANSVCRAHACFRQLPEGSYQEFGRVLVCSPELAYLQVATRLSFIEQILLAMELCGTYSAMGAGFTYEINASTTAQRLQLYAGAFWRGSQFAGVCNALAYSLDNSASPMESVLALALCLPRTRGGYGIKPPELNAHIQLGQQAASICGAKNLYCDLLWRDARLAFEYDSREFHSTPVRHRKDTARALALQSMGIRVQSVTYEQLINVPQMSALALIAAKATGKHVRRCSSKMLAKRKPLMNELLAVAHRPWSKKFAG